MSVDVLITLCFIPLSVCIGYNNWDPCGPPPGIIPRCDFFPELRSKALVDCRATGCPPGQVCCRNFCSYYCQKPSLWRPYMCPVRRGIKCSRLFEPLLNECTSDRDCRDGKLCCTVDCRKQCVTGVPSPIPM